MIELKNRLSYGKIIVTLSEKLHNIYELDQLGQPKEKLDFPDNSRVIIYSKQESVMMDGRVRGNKFRPAKRLRSTLGKEFNLVELV